MKNTKGRFIVAIIIAIAHLLGPGQAQSSPDRAQEDSNREDGIGLAPVRLELPMLPGAEQTVVVNAIYNAASAEAAPYRLAASLGDWAILKNGEVDYYRAGTQPNSACSWMVYSPTEVTVLPGKAHPIRVTISVPADATPGDHLAALFVESRPDNLEPGQNGRQVLMRFRLAALFYIMVPELTRKGALLDLKAEANDKGVLITPTLKNEGNCHIRPVHRVKIMNSSDDIVAETQQTESMPVLGNSETSIPLLIETTLPPGRFFVFYEVDFKDGNAVTERREDLLVKEPPAAKSSG